MLMDRQLNEIRELSKDSISCGVERSILGVIPVKVAPHAKRGGMVHMPPSTSHTSGDRKAVGRALCPASLRIDPTQLAKPFVLKKNRQQDISVIQFVC